MQEKSKRNNQQKDRQSDNTAYTTYKVQSYEAGTLLLGKYSNTTY